MFPKQYSHLLCLIVIEPVQRMVTEHDLQSRVLYLPKPFVEQMRARSLITSMKEDVEAEQRRRRRLREDGMPTPMDEEGDQGDQGGEVEEADDGKLDLIGACLDKVRQLADSGDEDAIDKIMTACQHYKELNGGEVAESRRRPFAGKRGA